MIHFRQNPNEDILTPADLLYKAAKETGANFELYCEDSIEDGKPHWAFDNYRIGGAMGYGVSKLFYTQPGWGLFFEKQMGRNNVKCVTYAIDEEIYPEVEADKIYDVGFIGNCIEGDGRKEYLDAISANFDCFISTTTPTKLITAELAKCKVVFNHIRYEEINIRFFESLASGAQVVSHSPALGLFAKEDVHYLSYRNPQEAVIKINLLLDDDSMARHMAAAARRHVVRNHTYRHRVQEMINFL